MTVFTKETLPIIDLANLNNLSRAELTTIGKTLKIKNIHIGGKPAAIKNIIKEYKFLLYDLELEDAARAVAQEPAKAEVMDNNTLQISFPDGEGGEPAIAGHAIGPGELTAHDIMDTYRKGATRLRRVQVWCLDNGKKDVPSETITVMDRTFGTIKRIIPLSEAWYEKGMHLEQCVIDRLLEMRYMHVQQDERIVNGIKIKKGIIHMKPAFKIVDMAPLTLEELEELRKNQVASRRLMGG